MKNGFVDSGLRLNQWIGQREDWGLAELEERDQLLRGRALEIWCYPTSQYRPEEKLLDMVTLDEDVVFTGKLLSKYCFKGSEQPVTSWTDMYQQVITMLHAENKAVLTKLALAQDASEGLSLHFSTSETAFNACRQIDTGLYVWTGTDTQYKINVLRKLFAQFGIAESELIFYLKDDETAEPAVGTRHETRKKYWEYALPHIRAAFGESGPFSNVNPGINNWIAGFIGIPGIHIDCVANYDGARVEFYLGMASKEKNKELFDYLYDRRSSIEKTMGAQLSWNRMDENKASKIYLALEDVDISKDTDWPHMANFHAETCKGLYRAFKEPLEQYFNVSI